MPLPLHTIMHALCTGWCMLICEMSYNTCSLYWLIHAHLWNKLQYMLSVLADTYCTDLWNGLQYMLSVLADACWSVKWVTIHAPCTGWCMLICEIGYNTCSLYWLIHTDLWNRLQYMLSLLADTCWIADLWNRLQYMLSVLADTCSI